MDSTDPRSPRVFITYAHESPEHCEAVRQLWELLRAEGVDARCDLMAAEREHWPGWMTDQIRRADSVVVIASPEYRRRADGEAGTDVGRGVQWETRLVQDRFYADAERGMREVLPVVLPGGSPGSTTGRTSRIPRSASA